MSQRTILSSGVWVSPVEKRFRPTPLEAVRLRPDDVALVPLEAGRRLHAFGFVVQDGRPLSQLYFRVAQDDWLPGKRAGELVSVDAFFPLARSACEEQHGCPAPPDRELLAWAASGHGVERAGGDAKIINAMYLDVDMVDAGGKAVFGWKKRFIDPNIFCRGPEEDHVWGSIPMDGVDIAAGWQLRFRPVFPIEGPPADFIPVWNLAGHYLPEAPGTACLRGRPAGWMRGRPRLPGRSNVGPGNERRRVHRRRFR